MQRGAGAGLGSIRAMPQALKHQIIAFNAAPFAPATDKALPDRLLICPWGTTDTGKGLVTCNATTKALLMRNQEATKRTRIALDFQHNSVEGSKTYTGEPLKVAAYGNLDVVEGEGIYLSALEWTPEGKEHAANGHYPDISPAMKLNENREVIWMHSAGLVRQGEIDGLELFDAGDTLCAVLNMGLNTGLMNWTASRELINIFAAMVGIEISEGASFDELKEQAETAAKLIEIGLATPEAKAAITKAQNPDPNEIETMNAADLKALQDRVSAAEKRADKAEKTALLEKATGAGKVIPFSADEIEVFSVEQFAAICDKMPAGQVRTESRGDGKAPAGTVETFSAADREVMKQLGLTEEQWKKAAALN